LGVIYIAFLLYEAKISAEKVRWKRERIALSLEKKSMTKWKTLIALYLRKGEKNIREEK